MLLQKWNREKRDYEPYEVLDSWNVKTFSVNMDEVVNCPHCGKEVTFGDCYTSKEIHTQHGIGYAVCPECYEKEWERERLSRQKGQNND